MISKKNRKYEDENWIVLPAKYQPEESLYKQLSFAIKYEGINLLVLKFLFQEIGTEGITEILQIEPTGKYSRILWFLYEWLRQEILDIPDIGIKNYVPVLNPKIQYGIEGVRSPRHRILNNLPGTVNFCPLIYKTEKLEHYLNQNNDTQKTEYLTGIGKEIIQRASAFLLLKDSKASFSIEGENPKNKRAVRWGNAIGQAGMQALDKEELLRLQQMIIESKRFTKMGFRQQAGFIGEHDRLTGEPIPDHISAKWEDLEILVSGLLATNELLGESNLDAVLSAAIVAFGFVFIHPFVDGNGRIHRYLIHHILARKSFTKQGIIFPISASILDHIDDYRKVLESYSHPVLDQIQWEATEDHNVTILNETIDYYRYYDATKQAEFLYASVEDTIKNIIPAEVNYLIRYDQFKNYLDNQFEMPDKLVNMLIRFLEQNKGKLSLRARTKEFESLTEAEVVKVEAAFAEVFLS